jgi:hypothetical protein
MGKHEYVIFLIIFFDNFKNMLWFITGFFSKVTQQVPLVEREQLTVPDHQVHPGF